MVAGWLPVAFLLKLALGDSLAIGRPSLSFNIFLGAS